MKIWRMFLNLHFVLIFFFHQYKVVNEFRFIKDLLTGLLLWFLGSVVSLSMCRDLKIFSVYVKVS